jgi:hypothetical protein
MAPGLSLLSDRMVAPSGAGLKVSDPVAWIRYDDRLTQEFPLDRLRLADFAGSVPWRQVRSRHSQAHYSGAYASATMGGFVVRESRLELARLLLADFDPKTQQIYAQPFRLVARVGGRVRRHVPDFLLVTMSGTARLVNVKPAALLEDPEIAAALARPKMLAERHGWEYEVWSGAHVSPARRRGNRTTALCPRVAGGDRQYAARKPRHRMPACPAAGPLASSREP